MSKIIKILSYRFGPLKLDFPLRLSFTNFRFLLGGRRWGAALLGGLAFVISDGRARARNENTPEPKPSLELFSNLDLRSPSPSPESKTEIPELEPRTRASSRRTCPTLFVIFELLLSTRNYSSVLLLKLLAFRFIAFAVLFLL